MRFLGMWRMAPWVRGPWLLLRRPGVAVALIAAAFVAGLPAAACAPYLSSATNATLHNQIAIACPWLVGDQLTYSNVIPSIDLLGSDAEFRRYMTRFNKDLDQSTRDLTRAVGDQKYLVGPTTTFVTTDLAEAHRSTSAITLMSRDGFADHITVLQGPEGSGAYISDLYAAQSNLRVGDTLTIVPRGAGSPAPLRVAAIYRDLRSTADEPWWCTQKIAYRGPPGSEFSSQAIPPLVLVDQHTFLNTGTAAFNARAYREFRLADPRLTLPDVERVEQVIGRVSAVSSVSNTSEIGGFAVRARLAHAGILPTVIPITAAGVLVGLLVAASAAVFWVLRRRRELTVLSTHGMSARSLGLKAAAESVPALLIGTVSAWGTAWWLVRSAGPDPVLSAESGRQSIYGAVASLVVSVAVVAITAGLRCRTLADEAATRGGSRLGRLPWELLLLVAAPPVWFRLGGATLLSGTAGGNAGVVVHVPARLLIVPIMVITGLIVFASRITAHGLRRRGRDPGPTSTGVYLGWRRIIREATVATVLAGATAAPIALAMYGATVTDSVRATVLGEARLHIGTDVVVSLTEPAPLPASLAGQATIVRRVDAVTIQGTLVDLLAIDPTTFGSVAFWDDRLDGRSMDDIVAPLRAAHIDGQPWPAVASGNKLEGISSPLWSSLAPVSYDITKVDRLPAEQGGYSILMVTPDSLGAEEQLTHTQIWVRGDPVDIRRKIAAAHLPIANVTSVDRIGAHTIFEPLTYTFDYLTVLSLLTGIVTIVGLLLYLEARTPGHRRAYVMLRRMGLTNRTHRLALFVELAIPLLAGLLGGLGLAFGLAKSLSRYFDVDVAIPPDTQLTFPTSAIVAICLAVVVVCIIAVGYAQSRIGRANPSEVLRDTI